MPQTPNHGYNVPNEGEQNWHIPLNENFEDYDTDIEIRDTASNRSNYDPKAGAKFLATDTGEVSFGDGSAWQSAFTLGGVQRLSGVGPDADGDVAVESPDDSIQIITDAGTSTLELRVSDLIANSVWSISGVESDSNGNVRLSSPSGAIQIAADPANNDIEFDISTTMAFSELNPNHDFLGVGRDTSITSSEYFGVGTPAGSGEYGGSYVDTDGSGGRPFYGYATAGVERAWHYYDGASDEWILNIGLTDVLTVDSDGNLDATGNKNFVQTVDTDDGEKEVVYTATEADTPHTESSGVAELEDGRAEVDLPEHFGWVTSDDEPLVVQTTPYGGTRGLKVVERSTDRIVVEDLDGTGDYEFAYTVRGTREGHADKQVVREPSTAKSEPDAPAPADD